MLLTSNGKKAGRSIFLTHLIMVESIKQHLQLEKEEGESPRTSRKIQYEGLESTKFIQEWTCGNTYRNSSVRNMAANSR